MTNELKRRVALVTGAGRGIGRASALALAAAGARVAATARTAAEVESLVTEITGRGGEALALTADFSDRAAPAAIVERIAACWGDVEILVNNAGIGSSADPRPVVDFRDEFWERTFAVNVTAPYLLTKLVLPSMLKRGWGRIINIASINASVPSLHGCAYVASKHALAGFSKAVALEVAAHGVTSNAVCPGVTATAMNDLRLDYDAARLSTTREELESKASPLGRRLLPDEIAALVAFLASDQAAGINGQTINVCGGTVMS